MSAAHAGVYVRTVFDTIKKRPSTAQNRTLVPIITKKLIISSGVIFSSIVKMRLSASCLIKSYFSFLFFI